MKRKKGSRRPDARVLRALTAGLEHIKDHFAWEGFSETTDTSGTTGGEVDPLANEADELGEVGYDGEEEETQYETTFDREDVEVAIDEFISHLIRNKLIKKTKSGRLPSLSRVFEMFFGEDHAIVKVADSFEDHIKGYFGFIQYDEMRAAYNDFLELDDLIHQELEAGAQDGPASSSNS